MNLLRIRAFLLAALLALSGCAANHEVGLCSFMGACDEPEGCHDGYKDDGTECDESITGNGGAKPITDHQPDHSVGGMTGGDDSQ